MDDIPSQLSAWRAELERELLALEQQIGALRTAATAKREKIAAIDRLIHHSIIFEMNVESYRRRAALDRKRGRGRAPTHATIKDRG